ncbi:hypothetical protein BGX38DRAFT_1275031 [Terfezia claveryi]|nr:hypothetical protein BGX38DRAFT_1275031 [Terfezia claveryi]
MSTPDSQTTVADEIQSRQNAFEGASSIAESLAILAGVVFPFTNRMESASNKLDQIQKELNELQLMNNRLKKLEAMMSGISDKLDSLTQALGQAIYNCRARRVMQNCGLLKF